MKKEEIINTIFRLILCFFIVIFILLLLLSIYSILDIFKTKDDAWISFWGSILGGGLTLIGVWFTIATEANKNNESLAVQYRPILHFDLDYIKIENNAFSCNYANCGRGEALNIEIKIIEGPSNYIEIDENSNRVNLLPCNENNKFDINVNRDFITSDGKKRLDFIIQLSYNDLYNIFTIKTRAILTINYNINQGKYYAQFYNNSIVSEKN